MKQVCSLLKINQLTSTAYHHESIGALENTHKAMGAFLRISCENKPGAWAGWLPYWCFTYNNTVHSETKYTPHELVFELADAEVRQSGRSYEELPSKLGREVEGGLNSLAEIVGEGVARAFTTRGHHESGGIDTITISTGADKKKEKKKKQKPPKIHLVQMPVMKMEEKGRQNEQHVQKWVIGKENAETRQVDVQQVEETKTHDVEAPRGFVEDVWSIGEKALDSVAEHALESDNLENGLSDKSSLEEQRGKKKKKKKAILKLLLLGAVLKAKIGTMLQILSFKLQVKFFIIALLGLAINLARFWLDVKKSHHQQPQKVIYYEHAQHQHHYDEHEEAPGWGPWSRSMEPGEWYIIYYEHAQHQHHYDEHEEAPGWGPWSRSMEPGEWYIIYYEHAQHQHHYDEHEEAPGWGPWSRSMEPGEQQQQQDIEIDLDLHNTPYRAQERIHMRDMRPVPSDI
ncbi:unnamed protein product [Plutella xylostella]|uniref:(diamondback moth) hypothetical protein n=1 Tax=Plutella xylostella TaxID=51655 RepID=A0A8S4FZV5_PLUXY|nr:unnamed protein product [Plutella xylostella]